MMVYATISLSVYYLFMPRQKRWNFKGKVGILQALRAKKGKRWSLSVKATYSGESVLCKLLHGL